MNMYTSMNCGPLRPYSVILITHGLDEIGKIKKFDLFGI
jgi:hypothetical protein